MQHPFICKASLLRHTAAKSVRYAPLSALQATIRRPLFWSNLPVWQELSRTVVSQTSALAEAHILSAQLSLAESLRQIKCLPQAIDLPVHDILQELSEAICSGRSLILEAPPGAGKTTVAPLVVAACLPEQDVLVVAPRRVAAKAAARRMAGMLQTSVGHLVGYQVRLESAVGPSTRIIVMTPGVLLRYLQETPSLHKVGAILFDEFHERAAETDLGLSLALDIQQHDRIDLRLLVMSATLSHGLAGKLSGFMQAATPAGSSSAAVPMLVSQGRSFEVDIAYVGSPPGTDAKALSPAVASAVQTALQENEGDVLVFLPGKREIRGVQQVLTTQRLLPGNTEALQLHGDLPTDAQDALLSPSPSGKRRVILATSIAESSLTLPGVRAVVDAGLTRQPAFDPKSELFRLQTVPVSQASADQRAGRAGRVAPGRCYRMWSEAQHARLEPCARPGVHLEDLAPLALRLASLGAGRAARLRWLDPPTGPSMDAAQSLLLSLSAITQAGHATALGHELGNLSVHPRLGAMLLAARDMAAPELGCLVASLLAERDVFRGPASSADMTLRIYAVQEGNDADAGAVHTVLASARELMTQLQPQERQATSRRMVQAAVSQMQQDSDLLGVLLALAYPDRIAQRKDSSNRGKPATYMMANGVAARLPDADPLGQSAYVAVAHVGGLTQRGPRNDLVFLAAPLSVAAMVSYLPHLVTAEDRTYWNAGTKAVERRLSQRLGQLVLKDEPLPASDAEASDVLLDMVRRGGLGVLPLGKGPTALLHRARWLSEMATHSAVLAGLEWPDLSEAQLLSTLPQWLGPWLPGVRSMAQLSALDWRQTIRSLLSGAQLHALEAHAPERWSSPTSHASFAIDYANRPPLLSAPMSAFFGPAGHITASLPKPIAGPASAAAGAESDTVPQSSRDTADADINKALTLVLLSPRRSELARVPAHELAGFWQRHYSAVRKELMRRYAKHRWPTDPTVLPPPGVKPDGKKLAQKRR